MTPLSRRPFHKIKYFDISIIGSGNLAWHLAQSLENTGHHIHEIYSRRLTNAKKLVQQLYDAEATDSLDLSSSTSSIFIIVVSDSAIEKVASNIILPEGSILTHTSGSIHLDALTGSGAHTGVFYPLQTFSKDKSVDFGDFPICVESEEKNIEKVLKSLANTLTKKVHVLSSKQRTCVHLAAVFACNFSNHMLTIAEGVLDQKGIDFELLHPLIVETLNKSLEIGPEKAQTGPAAREDSKTIEKHLQMLKKEKDTAKLYKLISKHIIDSK